MDPALLTQDPFWADPAPVASGTFPGGPPALPELTDHVLFATSGSTGSPKWVALSKRALLASAEAVNRHLDVTPSSRWGLALPVHHVGGFGVAARAWQAGCGFACFGGRWAPAAFANWIVETQVTHASLVPTQVHDLVAAALRAPSCLRAIVVGGGRLETATGAAARALGWPVLASYGMTEAASQIATQGLGALDDVYQPAPIPVLPIWQTAVSDQGTLRIAGPALFSGMLIRQGEHWVFRARESEWHSCGDRVLLENDRITPLGRADALVKVLGELVDPAEIERELADLSAGRLLPGTFAIVAAPDERAGHALVPVFETTADSELIETVLADYNRRAPGFRRLRQPVTLESFPRSALGKPLRGEILRLVTSGA